MAKLHNFSAGPAALPSSVIENTRASLLDLGDSGIGLVESSHRSVPFDAVIDDARARVSRLMKLDEDQEVLFLHGGAQTQFFMIAMNLLNGGHAAYLDTGRWSMLAAKEAARFGSVNTIFDSSGTNYDRVPDAGEWGKVPEGAAYLHYTSNNTVAGTQYNYIPDSQGVPLICDASSDILSAPIDGTKFDLLYAGAQKNLGPSGVTLVVCRKSLLAKCNQNLPTMLKYETHVNKGSMYNTPNTFGIYVIGQTLRWIEEQGGLTAVAKNNQAQADYLYGEIDNSSLYKGMAQRSSRSLMNVTFTTSNSELDTLFWKTALQEGISGLKGHRSIGGLRASIYNAQRDDAIDALVTFMKRFEKNHG
jgi:phosphoserine aminotransferase